ncbi:MAG TPA: transglycosylase domain-containing protein [Polyangiaceae bacterium]|nr:transglycosylase domain-containing protein [Polyangiaceae bacterium]
MNRAQVVKVLKLAGWATLAAAVLGVVTVVLVVRHYEAKLPTLDKVRKGYEPPQVTRVLSRDGTVLASLFTERRTVVKFEVIPNHVKLAFLAAEDASFYQHEGLDYLGMLRALAVNLRSGHSRQGASTITQQVVKNVLLVPERTYERKIKETILARRLEHELSKDEILSLYLNQIYLGHGRYGVEEASRYYFGKRVRELDVAEAATLSGLVASPERYSPRRDVTLSMQRRHYVLAQMLDKGFITPEVFADAEQRPLRLAPVSDGESELAPEVVEHVKRLLVKVAGEAAQRGGFVVETSIDPALQAAARKSTREALDQYLVRQKLLPPYTQDERKLWGPPEQGMPKQNKVYVGKVAALDDRNGTIDVRVGVALGRVDLRHEERFNPKRLSPSEFTREGAVLRVRVLSLADSPTGKAELKLELGPEAAFVALEPRTREVRALIGSYEGVAGGLDRSTQSRRQPGSAFKTIVYGYALHSRRLTLGSVLNLTRNAKDTKHKPPPGVAPDATEYKLRLRDALAISDNAAAQKVLEEVGAPNVIDFAKALGIESQLGPTPSLALGAYEVTPFEMTAAVATFAAGGEYRPPVLVKRITDSSGRELALPPQPPARQVIPAEEAYLITSALTSVVKVGTAKSANVLARPLAGKTGTTNQAKDAWFVGYSTDFVAGVWVGYDEAMPLGYGEAGAVTALPIWISFMKTAESGRPAVDFPRPPGIVTVRIDPVTGLLASPELGEGVDEEFLDGTAPTEVSAPAAPTAAAQAPSDDEAAAAAATTPSPPPPEAPPTGALPEVPPPF